MKNFQNCGSVNFWRHSNIYGRNEAQDNIYLNHLVRSKFGIVFFGQEFDLSRFYLLWLKMSWSAILYLHLNFWIIFMYSLHFIVLLTQVITKVQKKLSLSAIVKLCNDNKCIFKLLLSSWSYPNASKCFWWSHLQFFNRLQFQIGSLKLAFNPLDYETMKVYYLMQRK